MPIAVVDFKTGFNATSDTTVTTAAGNVPAGSLLLVGLAGQEGISGSQTITDTAGNTFSPCSSSDSIFTKWFYAWNCAGNASNVVQAVLGSATRYKHLIQIWCSGADAASDPFVVANTGTGAASVTTGTLASVPSGALIVGIATSSNDRTWSPDTGFTELVDFGYSAGVQYEIGGATGSRTVTATPSASSSCYLSAAVFRAAAATAATLSAASATPGTTTATVGATTDQASGTFYAVVDTAANLAGVTATQIKAGQKASGSAALAANSAAVSTTSPSVGVTGLSATTLYSFAAVQNNANGDSNVVTGTFTTATPLMIWAQTLT